MTAISDEFENKTNTPHDAGFKSAFKKKEVAADFFRHYFPEEIVKMIDFRTLKLGNGNYVDEDMTSKHSDIVYHVKIQGKSAFLYILFEHQSTPDYWMTFRLLCYMINLWKEFRNQHPKKKKLPVILPAVLYHGTRKWNGPLSFAEMFGGGGGLEAYIPQFSYELFNLHDYEDDRILLGGAITLGVVLYLLKHIFDDDFGERFVEAAAYLGKIDDERKQLEFLEWMLRYAYHARDDGGEYIDRGLEALGSEKAREVAMTIAERLRQEGMEKGMEKGMGIGMEKGMGIGRSALILKQLKKRFGSLPLTIEKKLNASGIDALDRFGESIFDFKDMKDVEDWWDKYEKHGNA